MTTLEVMIEADGSIHPIDPNVPLPPGRATLVWGSVGNELYKMSERALSDWLRPEEDEAWAYLQDM